MNAKHPLLSSIVWIFNRFKPKEKPMVKDIQNELIENEVYYTMQKILDTIDPKPLIKTTSWTDYHGNDLIQPKTPPKQYYFGMPKSILKKTSYQSTPSPQWGHFSNGTNTPDVNNPSVIDNIIQTNK